MTTAEDARRDDLPLPSGQSLVRPALAAVLEGADALLGAARIAVLLPDAAGVLRSVARRGFTAAAAQSLAALLGAGECAASLAAGRPLALGTGDPVPAELTSWLTAHAERAFLAVPLAGTGDHPGALALGFDPPARVTPARSAAAERFGALAGLAVTAARRATETERRGAAPAVAGTDPDAEYERQVQLAQALTEVLAATATAEDVAVAGRAAAGILLRVMPGVDMVTVWTLDDEGNDLGRIVSAGAAGDEPSAPERLPLEKAVGAARALREERTVVWQGDPSAWPERLREFARRRNIATVAHVPMQSGRRAAGLLTLASHAPRDYTPAELAFLTTLAGQLGGQLDVVRGRARVEAERRRLLSLIDTLPEGLTIVEPDGRVSLYNQAAVDILGGPPGGGPLDQRAQPYRPRAPDGKPFSPDELPLARALRGETVRAVEMVIRRPDGSERPLLVSAGPVRGPNGAIAGAISVFQDIAPLKELDRLKDEFINTVSHELRTPTTTIRGGALTLLKRGDRLDDTTRREIMQDIAEESERLHHLVEDLLTLTRSRAGMLMAPEPVRLHRLVNKMVLDLGARLGGYTLTVDVPPDLPVVEADPVALEQVLRNLLENGVQHSPRGERVEVTADARGAEVLVSVLDRGDGISPGDLDWVFEPFYRAPARVRSGAQGAGLGLAVCRRLVEMHGGRIWAENRPGGGAAFRFTLPLAQDVAE